jgi:hypothetical protein
VPTIEELETAIGVLDQQVALQSKALRQILELQLKGADGAAGTVVELEGGTTSVDVRLGQASQDDNWQPIDGRGTLPTVDQTRWPGLAYSPRPLDAITGITLHYTAGPSTGTAESTAAWQISDDAISHTGNDTPFPGLAYTLFVEASGDVILAHDLGVRVWHSAAVINGKGRNLTNVGICYAGDVEPNDAQRIGIRRAIKWVESQLGRALTVEGHRDAPYSTDCPGPKWPEWRADVVD